MHIRVIDLVVMLLIDIVDGVVDFATRSVS